MPFNAVPYTNVSEFDNGDLASIWEKLNSISANQQNTLLDNVQRLIIPNTIGVNKIDIEPSIADEIWLIQAISFKYKNNEAAPQNMEFSFLDSTANQPLQILQSSYAQPIGDTVQYFWSTHGLINQYADVTNPIFVINLFPQPLNAATFWIKNNFVKLRIKAFGSILIDDFTDIIIYYQPMPLP